MDMKRYLDDSVPDKDDGRMPAVLGKPDGMTSRARHSGESVAAASGSSTGPELSADRAGMVLERS